jgi:4-amino-4-deoxy-L-arabinose transferase-like glycosyltransferase
VQPSGAEGNVTPDRRTLLALFSLAFGLRIVFAAVFGSDQSVIPNHETYGYRIAERMAQDWSWLTTPLSPNAPGYRTLLSTAFRVFGVSWWTAVVLNSILGALTTFFLYRIGEKRIGPRAGLCAAVWLALFVHQIEFVAYPVREITVTFLFTWFAYNLAAPFRRMRVAIWLAFLYTLLIMTEPMFLVLLPVLILYLALFSTQHRVLSFQYLFLFLAFVIFFNVPWTVRNYFVYGRFVPVGIEAEQYTEKVTRMFVREAPAELADVPASAMRGQPGFFENSREFWRVVRLSAAPAVPEKNINAEPAWSLRHNVVSAVTYGVLLPFFAAGVIFAIRRRHRTALILTGAILSYALLRGFMTGDDRPRLLIEPLLILVSFYGVHELLRIRSRAGTTPADTG